MKRCTAAFLPLALIAASCSYGGHTSDNGDVIVFGAAPTPVARVVESRNYAAGLDSMPPGGVPLRVNLIGRYHEVFNDSNHVHWADGEKIGIKPLRDTRSYWHINKPLVRVASCADFYVEPLRYSSPYLVAEASALLHEIGRRFNDSLAARGGGDYRIRVTSLLRTPSSIRRLQRINRNAVDSSTHQLATTFDISYAQFAADSDRVPRRAEDLKGLLAEVLRDLRDEGRCWVKFERKQPCFHITTRPVGA